jgi:uncharacterized protein (TIGR04255 family)
VEEFPPTPMQVEQFQQNPSSGIHFQFQLLDRPPLPMLVFLAADRSSLVQVDGSRFFTSWRRSTVNTTYPRYEKIRNEFTRNLRIFNRFAADFSAEPKVTQAEISYINDVPVGQDVRPDALVKNLPSSINANEISAIGITQNFTYHSPQGVDYARLHVNAEPIFAQPDDLLRISLIYRGEPRERFPEDDAFSATIRFLDEGHDRIVQAFAENTTIEAHGRWGRVT